MIKKTLHKAALLGVALVAAACGDGFETASSPMDAPKPQLQTAFFSEAPAPGMTVMRRTVDLEKELSVTRMFGYKDSGWLSIPDAGIHVYVPQGAVMSWSRVAITMTAIAGDAVAFEFSPHGITFAKALRVRADVEDTEAEYLAYKHLPNGRLDNMIGVYYEMNADGQAVPIEKFPMYWNDMRYDHGPGDDDGVIEFYTNHFSGYAIAM